MGRYQAYPEYRESGVEWVGAIPQEWYVHPVFRLFEERKTVNSAGIETNVLSLSYGRIIRRNVEQNYGLLPESFNTYQVVNPGDVILRLTDLQNDKRSLRVGQAMEKGIITSAYLCLQPRAELDERFSYYLLHSYDTTKVYYGMGGGLRQSMKFSDFRRLSIICPPVNEQTQIAAFLDHETAKIDRLIAEQEKLIELLKEKRQAVISHAVTKGLDPDAPMKDSGVEWLGEIPAHWEVKQVRHATRLFRGKFGHRPRNDPQLYDGEYPFIQTGDVAQAQKYIVKYKQTLNELGASVSQKFPKGTLVMAIAANVGDLAILDYDAYCPDSVVGFKPYKCSIEYLRYALIAARDDLLRTATQNAQMNLNVDRISCIKISIPPSWEQLKIVEYLDSMLSNFRNTIEKTKKGILLLQERRTALISAAVTGKIDVRGWTATG